MQNSNACGEDGVCVQLPFENSINDLRLSLIIKNL